MITRILFFIGFPLLLLAIGGVVLLAIHFRPGAVWVESTTTAMPIGEPAAPPPLATATPIGPAITPAAEAATATPISTATATSMPVATEAPPLVEGGFYHYVRLGETLFSIGRRYGVSAYAICTANRLGNCNYIYAGQALWIPAGGYVSPHPYPGAPWTPTLQPQYLPYPGSPHMLPTPTPMYPYPSPPPYPAAWPTPTATSTLTPTPAPPTGTPAPTPTGVLASPSLPVPAATLTPTLPARRSIHLEWPSWMRADHSDSIRISLLRPPIPTPTTPTPGRAVVTATLPLVPGGTPEAPLGEAFGPDYKGYAVANLAGSAFDVVALTDPRQPLDQPEITWEWNIAPRRAGRHVVSVCIEVRWEPISEGGYTIQRQIWSHQLDIHVKEFPIDTGQLSLFTLIGGLIGSGLSVPWLYERLEEIRGNRRKG